MNKHNFRIDQIDAELSSDHYKTFLVFETQKNSRHIDFQLKDGTRQMFNYAYLMTTWTELIDHELVLKCFFSTHLVNISGFCLESIYEAILKQELKTLRENDERYVHSQPEGEPFVTQIEIRWKGSETKD